MCIQTGAVQISHQKTERGVWVYFTVRNKTMANLICANKSNQNKLKLQMIYHEVIDLVSSDLKRQEENKLSVLCVGVGVGVCL